MYFGINIHNESQDVLSLCLKYDMKYKDYVKMAALARLGSITKKSYKNLKPLNKKYKRKKV